MIVLGGKTAEPIEMPFREQTHVGPKNLLLHGGLDPPWEEKLFEGACIRPFQSIAIVQRRCSHLPNYFGHLL